MKKILKGNYLWQLQLAGWLVLLALWFLVTNFGLINTHVMPTPQKTWRSFIEMQSEDNLVSNILFSLRINLIGYLKCIVGALIVGFAIGLSPVVRRMFSQQVNALRFVADHRPHGHFYCYQWLNDRNKNQFPGIWHLGVPGAGSSATHR